MLKTNEVEFDTSNAASDQEIEKKKEIRDAAAANDDAHVHAAPDGS